MKKRWNSKTTSLETSMFVNGPQHRRGHSNTYSAIQRIRPEPLKEGEHTQTNTNTNTNTHAHSFSLSHVPVSLSTAYNRSLDHLLWLCMYISLSLSITFISLSLSLSYHPSLPLSICLSIPLFVLPWHVHWGSSDDECAELNATLCCRTASSSRRTDLSVLGVWDEIEMGLRRDWEEIEKRLRRDWEEIEKRLRRDWEEIEKRLRRLRWSGHCDCQRTFILITLERQERYKYDDITLESRK